MGGESKDILMAGKIDVEAHSSKEASSLKQHLEASKLVSGDKLVCLGLLTSIFFFFCACAPVNHKIIRTCKLIE